jgi:hypothetical protein
MQSRIGELAGEWEDNAHMAGVPLSSDLRALWKSPHYVRVPSWSRVWSKDETKQEIRYKIIRISRDGRQVTMHKKFPKCYTFWMSLPVGITHHLKNAFPQLGVFKFSESDAAITERQEKLDEWFRELCLDEKCMRHPKVLAALDALFSSVGDTGGSTTAIVDVVPDNLRDWVVIPEREISSLPGE